MPPPSIDTSAAITPPARHRTAGPSELWLAAGLVALVAIVFGRTIYFDFIDFDDHIHVVDNPYFHPVSTANLRTLWAGQYRGVYMPLTYTMWAGLARLGELSTPDAQGVRFNPYLFHAANVLLHAIATLLVW